MFGSLGGPELILIFVIALIVFGPRKLPEIGKSVGKMLVEIRRAGNDFKRTVEDEVETERVRGETKVLDPAPDSPPAGTEPQVPGAPATLPAPPVEPQETPRS